MTPYCKMLVLLLDQILSWIQFHYPIYHGVLRYWSSDNVKPGYYVSLRGGAVSINLVHQLPTGINWWKFIKLTLLVNSRCKDIYSIHEQKYHEEKLRSSFDHLELVPMILDCFLILVDINSVAHITLASQLILPFYHAMPCNAIYVVASQCINLQSLH